MCGGEGAEEAVDCRAEPVISDYRCVCVMQNMALSYHHKLWSTE